VTAISVASAFAESARRSICRNSGREGERAISADSGLFSGSVAKSCGNLLRSHAHWPAPFQAFSGGCQHGTSPNSTVSGGVFELLPVHVAWLCSVFRSVYASLNGALGLDYVELLSAKQIRLTACVSISVTFTTW